jgi:exodeoxyribonuclease I
MKKISRLQRRRPHLASDPQIAPDWADVAGGTAPRIPSLDEYDFLGFDFESMGLRKQTDQPVQGGFVKMTPDLSVSETLNVKILPNVYSIPGPRALEVTHLAPEDLTSTDRISEFKAAFEISSMLNDNRMKGKRVFCGYNTISYDEQLLRYFLFRNLMNPYLTTGKNSRRLDLFPIFQYLDYVRPGIIHPGRDAEGKVSWKLSDVMEANGLEAEGAHDAVEDTLFVMQLLKRFIQGAPDLVAPLIELSDRWHINGLIKRNYGNADFVMMFSHFGRPEVHPLAPATGIDDKGYKTLCVDLSVPPREWLDLSPEQIALQANQSGSAFRVVKSNACPLLFDRQDETLLKALKERGYRCDYDIYEARAREVRRPEFLAKLRKASRLIAEADEIKFGGLKYCAEDRLYNGFVSDPDKHLCEAFHAAASWEERAAMVDRFKDDRIRDFANRLIAQYAGEGLQTVESCKALQEQYRLRLMEDADLDDSVQTIGAARRELDEVGDMELRDRCAAMLDQYEARAHAEIERLDRLIGELSGEVPPAPPEQPDDLDFGLFARR